jgi:recombinational DNA repair ATPase RecF
MSIRIEEINVRNLGPIDDLQLKLGFFNLIYGKNESGKTYLVEFILRSLFKSSKVWKLRDTSANGKVTVTGLGEEPLEFSPTSSKKIDDYWIYVREGMPINMERLLVVKGAELSLIEDTPGGINRAILREFLSSEALLDDIQGRISKTVQDASISGHSIEGAKRGEIAKREESQKELRRIDGLMREIDELYSSGHRAALDRELGSVREAIEGQKRAKRHMAYQVEKEIGQLEVDRGDLSSEAIGEIRDLNQAYKSTLNSIQSKEQEIAGLREDCENYQWIEEAIGEYKSIVGEVSLQIQKIFLILASLLAVVSILTLGGVWGGWFVPTFGYIVTLSALALSAIFAGLYIRQQQATLRKSFDYYEKQQIFDEFEKRFGEQGKSLVALETIEAGLREKYFKRQNLDESVKEARTIIETTRVRIHEKLNQLGLKAEGDGPWDELVVELEGRLRQIEGQIQEKREELARLDVDSSDFVVEDPGVGYQKSALEELEKKERALRDELEDEQRELEALKQRICGVTEDEISIDWETLIEHLIDKREERSSEYKGLTAEILGKILVHEELQVLRQQEDEKIHNTLQSEFVSIPLQQITKRYEKVTLEGEQLLVSDPYQTFPLSELSTGAQEQVLLALRLGCAARILGKERLFLLLDDAFQYADWERRGWLLEKMADLAQAGWQILYLTMDDHIRDLFRDMGEKAFKKEFSYYALEERV